VLMGLARGECVADVARRLGKEPSKVARAVEVLAKSLGHRDPPGSRAGVRRVTVHADGAARGNPGRAGIGWVIQERGETLLEGGRYIGTATNNVAEYEAVLAALEQALELGASEVEVELDSELIVRQIEGVYRVKNAKLIERYGRLKTLIGRFSRCTVRHVPREQNRRADQLAKKAIDGAAKEVASG